MHFLAKAGVVLALAAGLFVAGYVSHQPSSQPVTQQTMAKTKAITQETVVTKEVKQETKKPDGTQEVTTTTTTTSNTAKASSDSSAHVAPATPTADVYVPVWSLGLTWTPKFDEEAYKPTGVTVGRRIGRTDIWVTGAFDWLAHTTTLGLSWEF